MFINKHKRSNVVEDHKNFLKKMKKFKDYMVEFEEYGIIKTKTYPFDCVVKGLN